MCSSLFRIDKIADQSEKEFKIDLVKASQSLPPLLKVPPEKRICTVVGLLFTDAGLVVLPNNDGIDVVSDVIQTYTKVYYPTNQFFNIGFLNKLKEKLILQRGSVSIQKSENYWRSQIL
jgi:hypothetical protein